MARVSPSRAFANYQLISSLFRGNNLRRTSIAVIVFIYNQWTGQQVCQGLSCLRTFLADNQFITTYGPTFYASYGLGYVCPLCKEP